MPNITVNTDHLETIIEMVNQLNIRLDNRIIKVLEKALQPFTDVGLGCQVTSLLIGQCQDLSTRLLSCSYSVSTFVDDYNFREKNQEQIASNLPQESETVKAELTANGGIFESELIATSISTVDHGKSISIIDTNKGQYTVLNNLNITNKTLANIDNGTETQRQKMKEQYTMNEEVLSNINNNNDTIKHNINNQTILMQQHIYSMGNSPTSNVESLNDYSKTQNITLNAQNTNDTSNKGDYT